MKNAQHVILCLCLCAAAHLSFADTHVWVGGNSTGGGWNTPANWTNEQGVAECPSANDTAVFNKWNETNVVSDADFDLFNSMAHVQLAAWSWRDKCGQTLVLSSTEDRTIHCRVSGSGRMIITGSRRIELAPRDSGDTKQGGLFASFALSPGGIVLEDDCTLVLAQTGFAGSNGFTYGPMTIGEDATVIAASNLNYNIIERLYGSGTIRCDNGTATDKWLQIGWSGNYSTEMAVFSGKITGYGKLINYSNQALTGTESDIVNPSNPYFYSCTGYGRNYMDRGWTYVASIGMKNQPSSIGVGTWILLGYGGHLGYIGEGETSDRSFCFEGRESTGLHPQYIDGGPHGGLELSGNLYVSNYGSEYNQRSVVFSGSNAAPCTVRSLATTT